MATVFLALGSNTGDRLANMRAAIAAMRSELEVQAVSPTYETAPLYVTEQPRFLNAAIMATTELSPEALLTFLKRIETGLDREVTIPNGPRPIDLDIIFYDDQRVASPTLTIPHPRMHERAFVLAPLSDIASDMMHPIFKKTVRELYVALPPQDAVKTDLTL